MRQGIQNTFKNLVLRRNGCYFFCLLRWAEILKGSEMPATAQSALFSDDDIINIFNECIAKGWIEEDAFVVNPVAILNHCQNEYRFSTVYKQTTLPQEALFIVYVKKPQCGHFVLRNKVGDVWDSWNPPATDMPIDSYRILV